MLTLSRRPAFRSPAYSRYHANRHDHLDEPDEGERLSHERVGAGVREEVGPEPVDHELGEDKEHRALRGGNAGNSGR